MLYFGSMRPAASQSVPTNAVSLLDVTENSVVIRRAGSSEWDKAYKGQILKAGDSGQTKSNGRAVVRLLDGSIVRIGPNSQFQIEPAGATSQLRLLAGRLYFFHRGRATQLEIDTPTSAAAIRGTEFVLVQSVDGVTTLTMLDGEVSLSDRAGQAIRLVSKESGTIKPGNPPTKTAAISVNRTVQWCLYYPAVLDLDELPLSHQVQLDLGASLKAYRSGDVLSALANYPSERKPASTAESVYYAGLLLSVGEVPEAEAILAMAATDSASEQVKRLAKAVQLLIFAVKGERIAEDQKIAPSANRLASELLAASYYKQLLNAGELALERALALAKDAAARSAHPGFAYARVADLEFSFGRIAQAQAALRWAMAFSPRNAQALTLRGFLFAAENRPEEAIRWFSQSIAVDAALGNAWLGLGLCQIRRGEDEAGRGALLIAAALEPQRAVLRSYVGKAFGDAGEYHLAAHELTLARELDEKDPTAWLYSALLNERENRFNDGIQDLQRSQQLSHNRQLYRSRLLLDEDLAVRSSSLASLYQEARMPEVSLREAIRALNYDYANYSSHLFISESYNALRDPTRFNLRYETVWFNELLLANLLSPVGAGAFSQNVSQQEYTRLFEQNRLGLTTESQYRSDGQFRELATQFGQFDRLDYALDVDYQHNDGVRINHGLDRLDWYTTLKFQLDQDDTLLSLTKVQEYRSGDNYQYYDQASARPAYRFENEQSPLLALGWHHLWAPESHTLAIAGRLENTAHVTDQQAFQSRLFGVATNQIVGFGQVLADERYDSKFEIWFGELNQIWTTDQHTVIAGGRAQSGNFNTAGQLSGFANSFAYPVAVVSQNVEEDFHRWSLYAYDRMELIPTLSLTAGIGYDAVSVPANFREVPVTGGRIERAEVLPKAAAIWEVIPELTMRGMYAWCLSGASFDESFRLEPAQLAGFIQSYRTVIPESVAGSVSGQLLKTWGGALDLKLASRTYLGLEVHGWKSDVERARSGLYTDIFNNNPAVLAFTEQLDYSATAAGVSLDQLLGQEWSGGLGWRWQDTKLQTRIPQLTSVYSGQQYEATLHELWTRLQWQHPAGPYARIEANWLWQWHGNQPTSSSLAGRETVTQVNLQTGWRFRANRGEIGVGILNLGGKNYRLDPLSGYPELPRERVFFARVQLNF